MGEEIEKRLQEKSLGGAPLLDPDQQHRYLGTFKERCIALLPVKALADELYQEALTQQIQKNAGGHLLINGAIASEWQNFYLQLALKEKIPFTIINDHVKNEPEAVGVIYALDTVSDISEPDLTLKKASPSPSSSTEKSPVTDEKKSFWERLFSTD